MVCPCVCLISWQLQQADYTFLASCTDVDSIDDHKDFNEVVKAFSDLDFTEEDKNGLFALVVGVVSLGNISFRETRPDESECDPSSQKYIDAAAKNFGVTSAVLAEKLVTRELRIRGAEKTLAVQDVKQATDAAAALAKFAYSRMFDWLVDRVNQSMKVSSGSSRGGQSL